MWSRRWIGRQSVYRHRLRLRCSGSDPMIDTCLGQSDLFEHSRKCWKLKESPTSIHDGCAIFPRTRIGFWFGKRRFLNGSGRRLRVPESVTDSLFMKTGNGLGLRSIGRGLRSWVAAWRALNVTALRRAPFALRASLNQSSANAGLVADEISNGGVIDPHHSGLGAAAIAVQTGTSRRSRHLAKNSPLPERHDDGSWLPQLILANSPLPSSTTTAHPGRTFPRQ